MLPIQMHRRYGGEIEADKNGEISMIKKRISCIGR